MSLRVVERLRAMRSVIARCRFSFRAGSPDLGEKLSSTARLGPGSLTVSALSDGGAAIFSMTSNVLPSITLIS
jgi:hypothetical protein